MLLDRNVQLISIVHRLSYKSVKVYTAMPKGIVGSGRSNFMKSERDRKKSINTVSSGLMTVPSIVLKHYER